jgi:hypothetical protein
MSSNVATEEVIDFFPFSSHFQTKEMSPWLELLYITEVVYSINCNENKQEHAK